MKMHLSDNVFFPHLEKKSLILQSFTAIIGITVKISVKMLHCIASDGVHSAVTQKSESAGTSHSYCFQLLGDLSSPL